MARLDGSFFGDFLFPLFILSKKARSLFGPLRMAADGLSIGLAGLNEIKLGGWPGLSISFVRADLLSEIRADSAG
jgi:hypothetical protein